MDDGEPIWVALESGGDIHHAFESKRDAIEYGKTVADVEGRRVTIKEAMFNAVGRKPDGA